MPIWAKQAMHRFRHSHTLMITRLASFMMMLTVVTALASLITGGMGLLTHDREELTLALKLGGLSVLMLVVFRITASGAKCPLCAGPVLLGLKCSQHRKTRSLLFSNRLRVAVMVLLCNRFVCRYCGEPTRCEVANRRCRHAR